MIDSLTAYDLADAFPRECREYIPNKIHDMEAKIIGFRAMVRRMELSTLPEGDKEILRMMADGLYPQDNQIMLNKYKKCLDLLKNKESIIEDKQRIELARMQPIAEYYNFLKQQKTVGRMKALCPFHQESTASFVIYFKDNSFHCFGCGEYGDSIDFVMKLHNKKFKDAIDFLVGGRM